MIVLDSPPVSVATDTEAVAISVALDVVVVAISVAVDLVVVNEVRVDRGRCRCRGQGVVSAADDLILGERDSRRHSAAGTRFNG